MTALMARPAHVVERNAVAYRRLWTIFVAGLGEPLIYLLAMGLGVGRLVGKIPGAGPGGSAVSYADFVAPGLLAAAAMNGSVFDATFGFFFKYKYARSFDAMLATPLMVRDVAIGEMSWSLLRGGVYAAAFLAAMGALGLVHSASAILAVPAALLLGAAFAGLGMAATTWMRSFVHFDYVNLVLIPLFLFSATFFPLSQYPAALQWVVRATPLYQGVVIERALTLGRVNGALLWHALYLAVMAVVGVRIAARRLGRLLQP